ncbi:hypothetical protein ACN469_20100 [Corallococcus terminator]
MRRTFGPMLEGRERFVFFDLFEATPFVQVSGEGGVPFLLIPLDASSPDGLTFEFGAGSVWLDARLLADGAQGFTGLRVAGGTLLFPEVASLIGNRIFAGASRCVLSLKLAPPDVAPLGMSAGQDAAHASASRPGKVTFELSSLRVERIVADDGGLTVYGAAVQMTRTQEAARVPELADGVLVPYEPSVRRLTPVDVHSALMAVRGTWRIVSAGWYLPTDASTPIEELGEAADAGAMVLVVDDGFSAVWQGLEAGGYSADRAMIAVDSRELALIARGRAPRIARQSMALWRDSALELTFEEPFPLRFVASREGAEALIGNATLSAHLDRPLHADGSRPRVRAPRTVFYLSQRSEDVNVHVFAHRRSEPGELVSLALANALLKTTPVEALILVGVLRDGARVEGAFLRLTWSLHDVVPFLPDPYAANFETRRRLADVPSAFRLTSVTAWPDPDLPQLTLRITHSAEGVGDLAQLLPAGLDFPEGGRDEGLLRRLFHRALGDEEERRRALLVLLDLSSNADHLGVGAAFRSTPSQSPALAVEGQFLAASVADLRVVALPQVSWEPVRTHPDDLQPGFPQPLVSRDDGGPLVVGVAVDTVHLVPIAPEPLLRGMVALTERPDAAGAVQFTLPFGIKAVAVIHREGRFPDRPSLTLNQPRFGALRGGLQVTLRAATPLGLPGGAIQTTNSTASPAQSVLGQDVEGFFNNAFHPGDTIKRVPLSRIDFSGYGASTLSRWANEKAAAVDVTKVEFNVLTGRTSYEVVEIQSILWPCMARVVRRITIRREGNGAVLRRDSGWEAATPGLFMRPDCACVFHPGVVKGMYNIREIRDTPRRVRVKPDVELRAVYFDADIAFENVSRGQASEGLGPHGERVGLVPSQRQLGFVQLINLDSTQKHPLSPQQLAELLDANSPVGGPLDCEIDVGGSGFHLRVGSAYAFKVQQPGPGEPHFALAAFGAPELPREGQWNVVRARNEPADSPEPGPVDPLGVPLIRRGEAALAPNANPHAYRFADAVDLFDPTEPATDYGLLFATQTFRVLFPQPRIESGVRSVTSKLAPLLADAYAMTAATGVFPRLKQALAFPSNSYELQILGAGQMRLSPAPLTQTVPPRVLELVKAAGIHAFTEYRGGDKFQQGSAQVELSFDSSARPSWKFKMGPISTVTDIEPFGPLMRIISTLQANSSSPPKGSKPLVEFGGALRPVEEFITVMKEFGLPVDLQIETPNSAEAECAQKLKIKLDVGNFELRVPGKIEGDFFLGFEIGTTRAVKDFPMPGGSVELFVEIEGKLQIPIINRLIYGGGLFRLNFITGYDPTEKEPVKLEIKLAAAAVGSVGEQHLIPGLLTLEGEVRYGYVFVADFAKKEYHPGVLLGLAVTAGISAGKQALFKVSIEAEVIGLVKRVDDEEINVRAEFTVAGEIELFQVLDVEYSIETEWDQKLPSKLIAALAVASHFGLLPVPIPP